MRAVLIIAGLLIGAGANAERGWRDPDGVLRSRQNYTGEKRQAECAQGTVVSVIIGMCRVERTHTDDSQNDASSDGNPQYSIQCSHSAHSSVIQIGHSPE